MFPLRNPFQRRFPRLPRGADAGATPAAPVGGFSGSVATLLTGTTASTAFSLLLLPVLTRLYPPSAFGVLTYFTAVTATLAVVASLRYETAIMLPEKSADASSVFWLSLVLTIAVALLCTLLIPWSGDIARAMGMPSAAPFLTLVGPVLLLMRLVRLAEIWYSRSHRFGRITAAQVGTSVTTGGTRVGAAAAGAAGPGGLIGGFIVGQIAAVAIYAARLKGNGAPLLEASTPRRMAAAAHRYRRFSLFSAPAALVTATTARLPYLLLPLFFLESDRILGLLGQASNALALPLGLIGGAVGQVFFVHAARRARDGSVAPLSDSVHRRLVAIALFPTLMLMLAGPSLFAFVFGNEWVEAGVYVRYVAPWLFFASVAAPLAAIYDVMERQRLEMWTSILQFLLPAAALVAGGRIGSIHQTLLFLGIAGSLARIAHIVLLLSVAKVRFRQIAAPYVLFGAFSLPFLAPTLAAQRFGASPAVIALVAVASGLLYAFLLNRKMPLLPRDWDAGERA